MSLRNEMGIGTGRDGGQSYNPTQFTEHHDSTFIYPRIYSLVRQPILLLEQLLARQTIGHVLDHVSAHDTHYDEKRSDVRAVASCSTNNTELNCHFDTTTRGSANSRCRPGS